MKIHPYDPDINSIFTQIEKKIIDLKPDFQREIVWNTQKQQKLIDSLMRHWHIPPIHLITIKGKDTYEVLDGKQRLYSIYSFIKDEFPFNGNFLPTDDFQDIDKKRFSEFPESRKNDFLFKIHIRIMLIDDIQLNEATELFFKIKFRNNHICFRKAKLIYGEVKDFLRETLNNHPILFSENTLGFPNYRMVYQDLLDKIFFLEVKGNLDYRPNSVALEKLYFSNEVDEKIQKNFLHHLNETEKILESFYEKNHFKLTKSVFLSYFWFIREVIDWNNPDCAYIKDFLVKFEEWRKNQQKLVENGKDVHKKYLEFETFLNQGWLDPSSLKGRHDILISFFKEFTHSGTLSDD